MFSVPGRCSSLDGDELLERRKLLLPPFHGKGMRTYERITEEEVMRGNRELASKNRTKRDNKDYVLLGELYEAYDEQGSLIAQSFTLSRHRMAATASAGSRLRDPVRK